MKSRLEGISRSYQALTERLADPDVIADSNLLMQVMKDRSLSEEVVMAFQEVSKITENRCHSCTMYFKSTETKLNYV